MKLQVILSLFFIHNISTQTTRPNIIFILADDLGFNDVGFHGSNKVSTPNIDALAYSGIILNNYYVQPLCTPSRSALLTGKYPIHTGMQHDVLHPAEARGLPLTEKLLPEYLRELGYSNHIVGKWHVGHYRREYTPLYRGFDSHLGYWSGRIDYYDHTYMDSSAWGLDIRDGLEPARDLHGQYATDIFTGRAVNIIERHSRTYPLFLYVAFSAVHSGNDYNPLPVPDEDVEKFHNMSSYSRRKFAGILSKLDDSVGQIIQSLNSTGLLENSIVIFSADNGGPAAGYNMNAASNWPLRGVKNTLWEGGVKAAGLLYSPLISNSNRIAHQAIHISDWLPTLYSAAGGNVSNLPDIDGINLWDALTENIESKRTEILLNIDDIYGNAALSVDGWKLVKGNNYNGQWDSWYGPAERVEEYNIDIVASSAAGKVLTSASKLPSYEAIQSLRAEAEVRCPDSGSLEDIPCYPREAPCLFNLVEDPCERRNLADIYPDKLNELLIKLDAYNATAIPPSNLPSDPRADPKFWEYTWTNFGDQGSIPGNPF